GLGSLVLGFGVVVSGCISQVSSAVAGSGRSAPRAGLGRVFAHPAFLVRGRAGGSPRSRLGVRGHRQRSAVGGFEVDVAPAAGDAGGVQFSVESSAGGGGADGGGGDPSGGGRCPVGGVPAEDAPESESGERGDGEGGPVGEPQEAGPHAPGADEEEEGDV